MTGDIPPRRQIGEGGSWPEWHYPSATIERPPSKTAGRLARSNRRAHIRRWPALANVIDAHIRSRAYVTEVEAALQRRVDRRNPPPHYCALMVVSDGSPVPGTRARASVQAHVAIAGGNHVHTVAVQAAVQLDNRVDISAKMWPGP